MPDNNPVPASKPFVLNDETTINSYGFRVINAGGDFVRFDSNPVMLNSHINSTEMTLGAWKNRRASGKQLLADTDFDMARPSVAEVAGQVERGYIKGCSMGLAIDFDDASWQIGEDGVPELLVWELMEASICAVPSNSNALALYHRATGELMAENEIKLSVKNLTPAPQIKNNNNMSNKIILTAPALSVLLGLGITQDNVGESEISNALVKLGADLSAEKAKTTELQTKLDAQLKLQAEALIDGAIAEEKLLAGERAEYVEFATANYSLAAKQIAKLKGKVSLGGMVSNSDSGAVKTMDDFEKLTAEQKLAFRTEQPEAYKKLFA